MRRREQELLNKIKEQQKMLESMKHEKSKVKLTFYNSLTYIMKYTMKRIMKFLPSRYDN